MKNQRMKAEASRMKEPLSHRVFFAFIPHPSSLLLAALVFDFLDLLFQRVFAVRKKFEVFRKVSFGIRVFALLKQDQTSPTIGKWKFRVQFDRLAVIRDRLVKLLAFLVKTRAILISIEIVRLKLDRLVEIRQRRVEV